MDSGLVACDPILRIALELNELVNLPGALPVFQEQLSDWDKWQSNRLANWETEFIAWKRQNGDESRLDDSATPPPGIGPDDGPYPLGERGPYELHQHYASLAIVHSLKTDDIRARTTQAVPDLVSRTKLSRITALTEFARRFPEPIEELSLRQSLDQVRSELCQRVLGEPLPIPNMSISHPTPNATERHADDNAWLSSGDIANLVFNLTKGAVSKRLERWRSENDSGWREVADRKPREPIYIYRWGNVKILFASGQSSDERPAK